mmetsp:Transcript_19133/g.43878  ORF Transcript_19133/g.43878 Transcript_19133/m.43878 type:complete len:213 (-) Transcript_19133:3255-3893(-)
MALRSPRTSDVADCSVLMSVCRSSNVSSYCFLVSSMYDCRKEWLISNILIFSGTLWKNESSPTRDGDDISPIATLRCSSTSRFLCSSASFFSSSTACSSPSAVTLCSIGSPSASEGEETLDNSPSAVIACKTWSSSGGSAEGSSPSFNSSNELFHFPCFPGTSHDEFLLVSSASSDFLSSNIDLSPPAAPPTPSPSLSTSELPLSAPASPCP